MDNLDIRWQQIFSNYKIALQNLSEAVEISQSRSLSKLEEQGLIHIFEYTYDLAWNVMKDYFEYQGEESISGSRDAIRLAFSRGLLQDGHNWIDMIQSRIKSSHTYNQEIAEEIADKVVNIYYLCFLEFSTTMEKFL